MNDYQLLVIGAGPGGYTAALRAAKLGLRVAVVESRQAGGTCLNRGCVPTKTLLHASQIYHDALAGGYTGVSAGELRVDMTALFERKRQVSEQLSSGVLSLFKSAGVIYIQGAATVTAPHTVQVDSGGQIRTYTAANVLIATGAVPARPPIPGLELPGVLTSDELLAGTERLYRSLIVIGGGVIGVEFATFFNDLGCDVTILEAMDRLLPTMDRELGQNLGLILKKRGVKLLTGALVERIERSGEGLSVCYTTKGAAGEAAGEAVLCAVGRRPNWEGLFPGDYRPQTDGQRIRVDGRYQTSLPHVYAVGDVSGKMQLAHAAAAQGSACAELLCGRESGVDTEAVPNCVHSRPEIATVGLTEQEAKAAGIPAKSGKCVLFSNAKTVILNGDRCFMKVLARSDDHRIIGAQLMCANATDMISQLTQAVAGGLTVEQLLRTVRPHPSFEEALTEALENLAEKLRT